MHGALDVCRDGGEHVEKVSLDCRGRFQYSQQLAESRNPKLYTLSPKRYPRNQSKPLVLPRSFELWLGLAPNKVKTEARASWSGFRFQGFLCKISNERPDWEYKSRVTRDVNCLSLLVGTSYNKPWTFRLKEASD